MIVLLLSLILKISAWDQTMDLLGKFCTWTHENQDCRRNPGNIKRNSRELGSQWENLAPQWPGGKRSRLAEVTTVTCSLLYQWGLSVFMYVYLT